MGGSSRKRKCPDVGAPSNVCRTRLLPWRFEDEPHEHRGDPQRDQRTPTRINASPTRTPPRPWRTSTGNERPPTHAQKARQLRQESFRSIRSARPLSVQEPGISIGGFAPTLGAALVIRLIAHTCIEATVRFAAELGYEVTMVRDATADYSDEEIHAALNINLPNYASRNDV